MIPILYDAGETNFDNNGIGFLTDAISCEVTEERNGIFELSMTYPVSGQHYKEIQVNKIIKAKPNDTSEHQAFRIYKISKPINQIVTIDAEHVSYQLGGVPVKAFRASGDASAALETLLNAGVVDHPFSSWSDISTSARTELSEPGSIRAALGGQSGSVLDVWGGEYEFDNFEVKLHARRGQDTDVLIEYGKNLTDLTQEQNISETYTGIMPYVKKTNRDSEEHVFLPEVYILSDNYESFPFLKISPVDLSADFENEEEISIDKLREKARAYIKNNGVGIPSVNISLSFVPLWQSPEYAKYQLLERVNLCDRLTVRFAALGVDATAKVIKTVYDTLKEKYISIELGDAKSSFADTVSKIQQQVINSEKNTESMMQAAISNATNLITGAKGGYVYFKRNADGQPEEIMIMNKPDISAATKVWRWNINGLGYSKNGINGPYGLAMTMDGAIVADYITTGALNAGLIKTGRIQSVDGLTYFDLDSGTITATELTTPGGSPISARVGRLNTGYHAFQVNNNDTPIMEVWKTSGGRTAISFPEFYSGDFSNDCAIFVDDDGIELYHKERPMTGYFMVGSTKVIVKKGLIMRIE